MKHKYLIPILSIAVISLILSSCSGWLSSPARDIYKEATVAWDNENYAHAFYLNSKAVLADPGQKRPIKFMDENFDEGINKIKKFLENSKNTTNAGIAEKRHSTYESLVAFYANVKEMKLPLKFKDKFKWETKFVDYSDELEQARKNVITVLYKRGDKLLADFNVIAAQDAFKRAREKFAKATEKDSLVNLAYEKQVTHGKKYKDSDAINKAASAYHAFEAALKHKDNARIKNLKKTTGLHVSDLWVVKGKELEAKGDLKNMENAITSYKNALKWNEKNEKAKKLQEAVKPKVAEIYYQMGRKAEKAKDRNLSEIRKYYEKAQAYVPDYKDVMNRFNTFHIMEELQNVQKNIDVTIKQHGELDKTSVAVNKNVKTANKRMGKVVEVSNRFRDINEKIKTTSKILRYLKPIPYGVGATCGVASKSLALSRKPVQKMVTFFNRVEKPVINPTLDIMGKTGTIVQGIQDNMHSTQDILKYTKESFQTAESCLLNLEKEEDYNEFSLVAKGIDESLKPTNQALKEINAQMKKINGLAVDVANMATVAYDVSKGLDTFEPAVKQIGGAAEKIDDVLKKEKWGFSAEKILKGASGVMDFMVGWAEDLVAPYLDKIVPDLPDVPGTDKLMANVDKIKQKYEQLQAEVNKLEKKYEEYTNYQKRIRNQSNNLKAKCFGKAYYVQSAKEYGKSDKGYWDIPGWDPNYEKDQTIQVYEKGKYGDRKFYIERLENGYVRITPHHGIGMGYLDVSGGRTKNGTDIQLWDKANTTNQKFKLKHLGDGVYKIYTSKGQVVCLAGRSTKNGTNVHIWQDHDVDAVKWMFIDTKTNKKVILQN